MAKLTEGEVRQIREKHAAGFTYTQLAAEYHLHPYSVRGIVKRRSWKHVP